MNEWVLRDGVISDLCISANVHETDNGISKIRYLKSPGVVLIGETVLFDEGGLRSFLAPFGPDYESYVDDHTYASPWPSDGERLIKVAGQACFAAFSEGKHTKNEDIGKYISHIMESGHFSVLEHSQYSLFIYGISRSLSHELARHRFISLSQLSQRYVNDRVLRFVERPEFQDDAELHGEFIYRCQDVALNYKEIAEALRKSNYITETMAKTDRRKHVQQTARSVLTNETETWLVATANVREWRHFLALRGSEHAETEIRILAARIAYLLQKSSPYVFSDVEIGTGEDSYPTVVVKAHGLH